MIRIGVVGVGIIASAVVEGFCTSEKAEELHFYLCPRNAKKAAALKERFPQQITVCASNQEAVDASELVILAPLPRLGKEIASKLVFRREQKVISFMSDVMISEMQTWYEKDAAPQSFTRMVPLPLVTTHQGPILQYPKEEQLSQLFAVLGDAILLHTENELTIAQAVTGLMSTHYQYLYTMMKAAKDAGLSEQTAVDFTVAFLNALNTKAKAVGIEETGNLAVDEMTPGGLNDMAWNYCMDHKVFDGVRESFEGIMERLTK